MKYNSFKKCFLCLVGYLYQGLMVWLTVFQLSVNFQCLHRPTCTWGCWLEHVVAGFRVAQSQCDGLYCVHARGHVVGASTGQHAAQVDPLQCGLHLYSTPGANSHCSILPVRGSIYASRFGSTASLQHVKVCTLQFAYTSVNVATIDYSCIFIK